MAANRFVERTCEMCGSDFRTVKSEIKRGYGRFCSRSCSAKRPNLGARKRVPVDCAWCQKEFEKIPSSLKNSKSGLYFCSRKCKDRAQCMEGLKSIHPSHYGDIITGYRKLAFRHLPHHCSSCGYDRIPEVLQAHHKDGNRSNNKLENLELLCPTCHLEHHFLTKTGAWASSASMDQVGYDPT